MAVCRLIIVFALLIGSALAGPMNLITNGSFEMGTNPPATNSYADLGIGSTRLSGWTIAGSGNPNAVIVWGQTGYWTAENGSYSVDLGIGATLSQTVTVTPGATYELSYYVSGLSTVPGANPKNKTLNVTVGSTALPSYTFVSGSNSRTNMGWVLQTHSFQPTSNSVTIIFADGNGGRRWGPILDNISLMQTAEPPAVPEPAMGLLFGTMLALLPLARRLRKT